MKEGDFIVAIGDRDVKWASHDEVVTLIKNAGDSLCLKLVTPMDRNYLKVRLLFVLILFCEKSFCSQRSLTRAQFRHTAVVLGYPAVCQALRGQWRNTTTASA